MKYTCELTIDLPRDEVVALFDDPDNLVKWQPGLQSFEHLSGEPGQPGAKSRLLYDEGGRRIEMIETIVTRDLPETFSGTYEAKGVWNEVSNHFLEEDGVTRWVMDSDFRFSGFMLLMLIFMRGAFRKQTEKTMQRFKDFAEGREVT